MANRGLFAMASPIRLRADFDSDAVRRLARSSRDADQTRRLLALGLIYDGRSRSDAARFASVTLQIIRDWVVKFNDLGPDGLIDRKAPGPSPKLKPEQWQRLAELIDAGPVPAVDGVVRWRLVDLAQWVFEEFRVTISVQCLNVNLRRIGYRKLSARPRHHAQDKDAIPAFKKTSQKNWRKSKQGSKAAPQ
jgi:transposase